MMKKILLIGTLLVASIPMVWAAQGVLNNAPYELCFMPTGGCYQKLIKALNDAQSTIKIQAYRLQSEAIMTALVKAQQRGVKVSLLLDRSNVFHSDNTIDLLKKNKIPYRIDYQPRYANNKVVLIDDQMVMTGNFSFGKVTTPKSAGNILIIHNRGLAQAYNANFVQRQSVSKSYGDYCMSSTRCKLSSAASQVGSSIQSSTKSGWDKVKGYWRSKDSSSQ